MLKRLVCLGFWLVVVAMPAQAVNLLANGNFNTGDLTGWWSYMGDPANMAITVNPAGGGYDGSANLQMEDYDPQNWYSSTVGQALAITAGMSFTESLVYSDTLYSGAGITLWFCDTAIPSSTWDSHVIGWDWQTIFENRYGSTPGDGTWKTFTSPVITAPAGTLSVSFQLQEYGLNSSVVFDNIVVTPEPATMLLLGLGGLALARRRKSA